MDILINDIECQEVDLKMNEETIEPMEHQAKVEICFTLKIGLYNLSETLVEVNQAIIAWFFNPFWGGIKWSNKVCLKMLKMLWNE